MSDLPNIPEVQIGRLLGHTARLLAVRTDREMESLGLYRGQAILLVLLSEHDGLAQSEIAEKLGISPAAATKVIKRLEALAYLERRPDPSDERLSRVFLLEAGWAVIAQIKAAFHQVNRCLLTGLAPEERAALIGLLQRVHANLQEAADPLAAAPATPLPYRGAE
jgi:DNA-binding MarR family transcriptional regulator